MICGSYFFAMEDLSYTFVNDPMNYALTAVFVFCAMILSHLMTMRVEELGYCGGCEGKRIAL